MTSSTDEDIEWVSFDGGVVVIGGSRRGILFGDIGPPHESRVQAFEISRRGYTIDEVEERFGAKGGWEVAMTAAGIRPPTEGEWLCAHDSDVLEPLDGDELLIDRIEPRGYWGQPTDGRPKGPNGQRLIRRRSNSGDSTVHLAQSEISEGFVRFVRPVRPPQGWRGDGNPLPLGPDPTRRFFEEVIIATIVGIIPSFAWAAVNARPGYIAEGWPGLILGGVMLGIMTSIIWRPRYRKFTLQADSDGQRL
ncbi:MAG: hypothetical protein DBX05_00335 [Candidatus Poseidoniales archaeon]|nr:MAG: hypothetical protein CBE15_00075 [Euryarchaeota archaeon TMED255]RAH08665.1 MAG: hypothetical protein CMA23_006605 [Euryarchaeota archaeon]RCH74565.1 MAG: hypothetical protein DBX05_00335 [Candidatus Poseidoniales archaeon]|tara:strand:- start:2074 stop:2820 length:747 start_codon:yes stop_codon:yes gene_type:complete